MASKGREKKVQTLLPEAIKIAKQHSALRRSALEQALGIKPKIASRLISAMQKAGVLSRPETPIDLWDPMARETRYLVQHDKPDK